MAAPDARLGTAQSQGNMSVSSRMSNQRREKLLNLQKREELKDALSERFKHRFGKGSTIKEDDEVSVCSAAIRSEVGKFALSADLTMSNLARLERRIQSKAKRPAGDNASEVSAYSRAPTVMSRARSVPSLAGSQIVGNTGAGGQRRMDWSRLDEYAGYLHEQDCIRQHLGAKALQSKFRSDLDQQIAQKRSKMQAEEEEDHTYHQNSMVELERWKQMEKLREEEKQQKIAKEKEDRDAQLAYEKQLKAEEEQRKKDEEAALVAKIVDEMEAEQNKFVQKKEQQRKQMRKVFEENAADQAKRQQEKRLAMEREAQAMHEYSRALDEQEEQRAREMQQRIERQNQLMAQLQDSVDDIRRGAGDNDAARARAQQEEMDRHFAEAENVKQNRLKQLRLENQAYLLRQMEDKDKRKDDDKELSDIQAMILARDTEEYNEVERQKVLDRKKRMLDHSKDIKRQMAYKLAQSAPAMSDTELLINKPLLKLVNRTLDNRDAGLPEPIPEADEDED